MPGPTTPTAIPVEEASEVRRLLGPFRRTKPLRVCAEGLLAGLTQPPPEPGLLLRSLGTSAASRWRERALAAWAAGIAPPVGEERRKVAACLVRVLTYRPPRSPSVMRPVIAPGRIAAGLALTALWLATGPLTAERRFAVELLVVAAGWLALLLRAADDEQTSRPRSEAARALGRLGCIDALGALAEVLGEPPHTTCRGVLRVRAAEALARVASSLTPEQYGAVPPGTTAALVRVLACRDPDVLLIALSALGAAGGGEAAEAVRRLAGSTRVEAIRVEAARVLPILRERHRQEQAPRRLLRAADPPESAPHLLLRPAQDAAGADQRMLLRAAEADAPEGG